MSQQSSKGFTDSNIKRRDQFLDQFLLNEDNSSKLPNIAGVEISLNGACTRRCEFCPRVDDKRYPNILKSLDIFAYKNLIEDLNQNNFTGILSFSGFSEPLLTKNFDEYLKIARSKLIENRIEIVSNGDCLPASDSVKKRYLDNLFESGLNTIRFSLYDGEEQYKKMIRMKSNFGYNDEQIILRKRYLNSENNFGMTLSNRAGALDISKLGANYKGQQLPLNSPCFYPFYKLMIDFNGEVLICSHDWHKDLVVGNINEQGIYDIWWGEKFMSIRRMLSEKKRNCFPCSKCDVEGTLNGGQFFNYWQKFL